MNLRIKHAYVPAVREDGEPVMNSTPSAATPAPESNAVCEACGRPDAVRMGDRWLCPDCISTAGSCCPEFGAWDAWSSEASVAARTRAALAEARRAGWEIVPACSCVAAHIEGHPEFTDLITSPNQP